MTGPLAKVSKQWNEDKLIRPPTMPLRVVLFRVLLESLLDRVEEAVQTEAKVQESIEANLILKTSDGASKP